MSTRQDNRVEGIMCLHCGCKDSRPQKYKYEIEENRWHCAKCGLPMGTFNYTHLRDLRFAIGALELLQWRLGDYGLVGLGGDSVQEIEENIFKKLNDLSVAFDKFTNNEHFHKETLSEHRTRMLRIRERSRDSEIRKSIPKELKKGKTRTQINKMVEAIKNRAKEEKKEIAGPNVISMNEYRKSVAVQ